MACCHWWWTKYVEPSGTVSRFIRLLSEFFEENFMMRISRLMAGLALAGSLPVFAAPVDAGGGPDDALRAQLQEAKAKQKGVTLYLQGATLSLLVTDVGTHFVTGRSQAHGSIVVRLDRIDAAAMP